VIIVVVGKINDGKTTKMKELYQEYGGYGFVAEKVIEGDKVIRYDALELTTGHRFPLAIKGQSLGEVGLMDKSPLYQWHIGPYYFLKSTVTYMEEEMIQAIKDDLWPLYFDEVGQMELTGSGFYGLVKYLIHMSSAKNQSLDSVHGEVSRRIYLSVRDEALLAMKEIYQLTNVKLIKVLNPNNPRNYD